MTTSAANQRVGVHGEKPQLVDLYCGAGGASEGYTRAGFDVTGVDLYDQPNYPFAFVQADALDYIAEHADEYDCIAASPPCQAHSTLRFLSENEHLDLIGPTRELLEATGLPYVIENVMGAPLLNPIKLCGSSFGLNVWRHRLFECSFPLMANPCTHWRTPKPIDVTGTGGPSSKPRSKPGGGLSRKPADLTEAREALGIDWMTRAELSEAIPPAFTEWVGSYLMAHLEAEAKAAA